MSCFYPLFEKASFMVISKLRKVNNMAELQLISTIKAQQSEYLIALTGEIF